MSTEYRINFSIERSTDPDAEEFEEIGFGSSGAWSTLDQAVHMLESAVQNGEWETEPGQPDPEDIMRDIERSAGDL